MEQRTPTTPLLARESGESVVIYDPDNDDAWIRSENPDRTHWNR